MAGRHQRRDGHTSIRLVSGVNGISGGDSQEILYSTDAGASWQISQSGFFGGGFPGAQMLSATRRICRWTKFDFRALFGASTDGGASWDVSRIFL